MELTGTTTTIHCRRANACGFWVMSNNTSENYQLVWQAVMGDRSAEQVVDEFSLVDDKTLPQWVDESLLAALECPTDGWPSRSLLFAHHDQFVADLREAITAQQLDKRGYRLIGECPYSGHDWHVARWMVDADGDRERASVTVGYSPTLRGCLELVDEIEMFDEAFS